MREGGRARCRQDESVLMAAITAGKLLSYVGKETLCLQVQGKEGGEAGRTRGEGACKCL
jgi:hypothetical protein